MAWTVLITAGELVGRICDLGWFAGVEGEWLPARVPPTILKRDHPGEHKPVLPPTFLEWYEDWVRRALADLADQ